MKTVGHFGLECAVGGHAMTLTNPGQSILEMVVGHWHYGGCPQCTKTPGRMVDDYAEAYLRLLERT